MIKRQLKQFFESPAGYLSEKNELITSKILPDRYYLKKRFKKKMGYSLDLNNPKTFNEKIQWLKLHYRNPVITKMADKYHVREYVKDKVGEHILIPLIDVFDHPAEIDWDKLPEQYALKATHGSGWNVICKNKKELDLERIKYLLKRYYKTNMHYINREWAYKNIKPRFICEKLLLNNNDKPPADWKFFVFNGEVKYIQYDKDRFEGHFRNIYDRNFIKLDLKYNHENFDDIISKPSVYKKMINIAESLSDSHPFTRVDLYFHDQNIFFGEITLYPEGGYGKFEPFKWDKIFGKNLNLPNLQ